MEKEKEILDLLMKESKEINKKAEAIILQLKGENLSTVKIILERVVSLIEKSTVV